jgi:hypothetical protein
MLRKASEEDNVNNVIHQTLHLLGFHSHLYQFWKDRANGFAAHPTVSKRIEIRGINKWALATPEVVKQARLEFGDEELKWVELEDGSNTVNAGSNWEKRNMLNDVMTRGCDVETTIYSKITLKAMEDTGWYTADLAKGQSIAWGYKAGPDFFQEKCVIDSVA